MVGVIGSGSFGTAIANILAHNSDVLLYSRRMATVQSINEQHKSHGFDVSHRITATNDISEVAKHCRLIFPIVPSYAFRSMMRELGPHLRPSHFIIHGTKGFDLKGVEEDQLLSSDFRLRRAQVRTMSEVVCEESSVLRVGCLSGPNLASEIMAGLPTATLVGSRFKEVIQSGQKALSTPQFSVFGSYDILGAELAGALKNVIALGSGVIGGLGMGRNLQGLLIARGLSEMIHFGKAMGTESSAFLGVAGIGDLVTTATSPNSRNYTFGMRLAKGETAAEIRQTMPELAEGVRTLLISRELARQYKLHVPITHTLYEVIFKGMPVEQALAYLMRYKYAVDVDFM